MRHSDQIPFYAKTKLGLLLYAEWEKPTTSKKAREADRDYFREENKTTLTQKALTDVPVSANSVRFNDGKAMQTGVAEETKSTAAASGGGRSDGRWRGLGDRPKRAVS